MQDVKDYQDLGWANGWGDTPEIVEKCQKTNHERTDIDVGPPWRGMEHVVTCDVCKYVYRYDSSD